MKTTIREFVEEIIKFVIIVVVIVIPVRLWVAQPFIVSGQSMDPTFEDGEYLIIDELSYHFKEPEEGEVVVFRFPQQPSKFFIKRITDDLGEGNYFVEGDNRNASYDSRSWGPLPRRYIVGRAFLRLFPVDRIDLWPGADVQI